MSSLLLKYQIEKYKQKCSLNLESLSESIHNTRYTVHFARVKEKRADSYSIIAVRIETLATIRARLLFHEIFPRPGYYSNPVTLQKFTVWYLFDKPGIRPMQYWNL